MPCCIQLPRARSLYAGYRFPAEIISHAIWLYFRFPLGLRMVEEMLAARGIIVSHETVRQWARKFGQGFANQIHRRLPGAGDKWHLDEVVLMIAGVKHWLWRAVDQTGFVLDVLVQSRRDKHAAKRLLTRPQSRRPAQTVVVGDFSRAASSTNISTTTSTNSPSACMGLRVSSFECRHRVPSCVEFISVAAAQPRFGARRSEGSSPSGADHRATSLYPVDPWGSGP